MTTTLLLPAISSHAAVASLNSKLVAPLLRTLVLSQIGSNSQGFFCSGRSNSSSLQRKPDYYSLSRIRGVPVVESDSMSGVSQESQVVVKRMGTAAAPVLLLDVMGTLVRDPFYEDIPAFFGMTMKELLAAKHPTAWIDFECGHLTEEGLSRNFFADGRDFDIQGLKECMSKGYIYLEGVEELLQRLLSAGFTMHAFSNYPCWYSMIEDKLQLSHYMPWTFVSCHMGLRKPESEIYLEAARQLKLDPSSCVFVDDRRKNVEAAIAVGMRGIVFQNAKQLEEELVALGCSL